MSIGAAVISRWNATSLNSTVAALFPSSGSPLQVLDQESSSTAGESGSPAEQPLPRARVVIPSPQKAGMSAAGQMWRQIFFIYVFCDTRATAVTHRKNIRAAFENSHRAAANPFVIAGCEVSELNLDVFQESVRRHDLSFTELCFSTLYSETRILHS